MNKKLKPHSSPLCISLFLSLINVSGVSYTLLRLLSSYTTACPYHLSHCLHIPLHAHLIYLIVFNSINLTGMEEKHEPRSSQHRIILNFLISFMTICLKYSPPDNVLKHHQSLVFLRNQATFVPLTKGTTVVLNI
jgi:hypothetical protein